jgi:hypothetical protein
MSQPHLTTHPGPSTLAHSYRLANPQNSLQRKAVERFVLQRRRRVLSVHFLAWSEHTTEATNKAMRVQARAETSLLAWSWSAWRMQLRAKRRRDALEVCCALFCVCVCVCVCVCACVCVCVWE